MSRLRYVLLLVVAGCLLAGCSGDAKRAAELLSEVQAVQAAMKSGTVDMRMVVSSGDQRITMYMSGGGYLKGPRAGQQFLSIRTEGAPIPMRADIVTRGGRGYLRMNGAWQSFPLPDQAGTSTWTGTMGELAQYVKDVSVTENTVVAGLRGTTVAGVLDTAGLIRALSQMSAFSGATGASSFPIDEIAKHVSDTRVVLFISARTHMIRSAVLRYGIDAGGQKIKVELYLSRTSVNRPVQIPSPS